MTKKVLGKKNPSVIDVRARSSIVIRPVPEIDTNKLTSEVVNIRDALERKIESINDEYDFIIPKQKQRSAIKLIGMAMKKE